MSREEELSKRRDIRRRLTSWGQRVPLTNALSPVPSRARARATRKARAATADRLASSCVSVTPTNLWNQNNLAVRPELRRVRILEYLAINGDRHALLDLPPQPGMAPFQLQDQPPERGRLHIEFRLPAGQRLADGTRGENDLHHQPAAASSAARTFGGDIGRSCIRSPAARRIALPIAAMGGMIGTSPTPRAPNGCRGFGPSTITASIIGTSEATGTR